MVKRTVHIKYQKTEFTSLTSIFDDNLDVDIADETHEPFNSLQVKISLLQEVLDCTEEEAERIALGNY